MSAGIAAAPAAVAAKATNAVSAAVAAKAVTTANGLMIGSFTTITIIGDGTNIISTGGSAARAVATGIITIAAGASTAVAAIAARIVTVAAVRSL